MDTSQYKEQKLTPAQRDELQAMLQSENNLEYNILKVIEEATELNEVLLKYLTKHGESRPSKEKIIEEAGDLLFRLFVLTDHINMYESVHQRITEKSYFIYDHLKEGGGTKLIIERKENGQPRETETGG